MKYRHVVVRRTGVANLVHRRRGRVGRIRRLRVILERLVMRNVVGDLGPTDVHVCCAAHGFAVRVGSGCAEAALEPTPAHAFGVQQVTYVIARHRHRAAALEAFVKCGSWIAGDRAVVDRAWDRCWRRAVCLTSDQI